MAVRYFNLKEDRQNVKGAVVAIDTDSGEVEEFTHESYRFEEESKDKNGTTYRIFNQAYPIGSPRAAIPALTIAAVSIYIGNDREKDFKLKISKEGTLEAIVKEGKKIFVSEIDEEEALKLREDAQNWMLMQDYIMG